MATKKDNSAGEAGSSGTEGRESSKPTASTSMASDRAIESLWTQAYQNYEKTIRSIFQSRDIQAQVVDAYGRYVKAVQEVAPRTESQWQIMQAYQNWANVWQRPGSTDDMRNAAVEAYNNLLKTMQENNLATGGSAAQERAAEAHRGYIQEMHTILAVDDIQNQIMQAYRDFLRTLQALWSKIDPESLDISALALVGQMLQAAAALTASATMQLQQQRAMIPSMQA